jgi:hypothetical protein
MTEMKRGRGRPEGSGKNDLQALASVADLLVKKPKLTPTAAMRHIISGRSDWDATPETLLRRLQGKWAKNSSNLMESARKRVSRTSDSYGSTGHSPNPLPGSATVGNWAALSKTMQDFVQSPAHRTLQAWLNSPNYIAQISAIEKFSQKIAEDPFQKRFREAEERAEKFFGQSKWGRGLF